jgi:phosphate uptake regulator
MYKIIERFIYLGLFLLNMKRKIIKLGQATFVTSLPSKWIRENNLEKGDYLEVEEKGNTLSMSTEKKLKKKDITIDLKKLNTRLINTFVQSYYLLGYDQITLIHDQQVQEYKTKKKINTNNYLQELINRRFVGVEIIEQSDTKTVIMDLGGIKEETQKQIFNRLIFLVKIMANDCYQAIKDSNSETLSTIKHRYNNANRFLMHYQRIIAKTNHDNPLEKAHTIQLLGYIKEIVGTFRLIAEVGSEYKSFSTKVMEIFNTLNKSLDISLGLCLNFNREKTIELIQIREKIWQDIKKEGKKLSQSDAQLFSELRVLMFPIYALMKTNFILDQLKTHPE